MRNEKLLKVLLLAMTSAFSACQKNSVENINSSSPQPAPVVSQTSESSPTSDSNSNLLITKSNSNSPIRKVDFENFTYTYPQDSSYKFTLKNGTKEQIRDKEDGAILQKIEYGDVTNDGEDEALIDIYPLTGGNCQCEMVFIYTMQNDKPKLLWSFDTWDKAEGGFKKAYAENGNLVVELFGDNKYENDKWDFGFPEKSNGYCCPTAYTKIRFKWNGEKFVTDGKPELFDYDWKSQQKKN